MDLGNIFELIKNEGIEYEIKFLYKNYHCKKSKGKFYLLTSQNNQEVYVEYSSEEELRKAVDEAAFKKGYAVVTVPNNMMKDAEQCVYNDYPYDKKDGNFYLAIGVELEGTTTYEEYYTEERLKQAIDKDPWGIL